MKPPFKLGWADYALVGLTCLMILLFFDRWKKPVEDWLKEITRPEPHRYEPAQDPEQGRTLNEFFGIKPAPQNQTSPETPTGKEENQ